MTKNPYIAFVFPFVLLITQSVNSVYAIPHSRARACILIMYSGQGAFANQSDALMLGKYWEKHLVEKQNLDSSWPFNATVEYYDVQSNPTRATSFLLQRLTNRNLPNVSVILGPESAVIGYPVSQIAVRYGIPVIYNLMAAFATGVQVIRPSFMATSFILIPPAGYFYPAVIDVYAKSGVKTLVAVYIKDPRYVSEAQGCITASNLATSRGISVTLFNFLVTNTTDQLYTIVENIRDNYKPDAVIWCESQTCLASARAAYNPVPLFKRANYLPKALSISNCLDAPGLQSMYNDGTFEFISGGQLFNSKASGPDFTEDANPYSSVFRPPTPAYFTVRRMMK